MRTLKQLENDERLREKFKKINQQVEEIIILPPIIDAIPPPPVKLGRVRTRKIYFPYDLIEQP